jgi:type IV pilus assembly PilN-like protein
MTQQINLFHEALSPRRERWRAAHGLWAAGAMLLTGWALAQGLNAASAQRDAQVQQLRQQMAAERERLQRNGGLPASLPQFSQAELDRLRGLDAAQQRVQAVLAAQGAGRTQGYTPYLLALSRQAQPALWITGFTVSMDGEGLEIRGRMLDAAALPDYLRSLNGEAQFKGRSFAQLNLKTGTPEQGVTTSFTEFTLRSRAAGEGSK